MMQAERGQEQMDKGNDGQEEGDARLGAAQRGVVYQEITRVSGPQMWQENHKVPRSHVDESAVLPKKQRQQQA